MRQSDLIMRICLSVYLFEELSLSLHVSLSISQSVSLSNCLRKARDGKRTIENHLSCLYVCNSINLVFIFK